MRHARANKMEWLEFAWWGFCTDSDIGDVATDLQFILAAVEGERLNHTGSCSQKLPVQLPHWQRKTEKL